MASLRLLAIFAYFMICIAAILLGVRMAEGHHNPGGRLPGVPNTPAIQQMFKVGELVHCFNDRASNYPGFRAQTDETLAAAQARIGLRYRLLPGTFADITSARNAGCNVWHNGREDNFCSGCAANVLYANAPVTVNYKLSLGYVHWVSTIGHEHGHIVGMHEGYDDVNFLSHINTYGRWASPWESETVMDFGTHTVSPPRGVWALTQSDYRVATEWLYPKSLRAGRDKLPDGRRYIWYCGRDTDKTTSIALLVQYSGGLWWPNIWTENFTLEKCPDGSYGGSLFLTPEISDNWGLVIRQGNKISWDSSKGDTELLP